MDKIFSAITGDKDDRPSASSLPPGNKAAGGAFPIAGNLLNLLDSDDNRKSVADDASNRAGGYGNSDMFKSILGSLMSQKDRVANEEIDEDDAVRNHKKYVMGEGDDGEKADARGLGAAAAMQALKKFNSGEAGKDSSSKGEGGFLALAMAEATKLFDDKSSQGKLASGTEKESVVKQAAEMAFKMYLKSQGKGQGPSQGDGGLMGMASKFLK